MNAGGAQLDSQIRTIDRYSGPNQLPHIHTTLLFFTLVTTKQRNLIKIVSLSLNLLRHHPSESAKSDGRLLEFVCRRDVVLQ